jgi:hypothetical protein
MIVMLPPVVVRAVSMTASGMTTGVEKSKLMLMLWFVVKICGGGVVLSRNVEFDPWGYQYRS